MKTLKTILAATFAIICGLIGNATVADVVCNDEE